MGILKNIKDGWLNSMKANSPEGTDPEIQKLAEERAKICGECPELKSSGFFRTLHKIVNNSGGQCGCQFPANVYAPAKKCPLEKW